VIVGGSPLGRADCVRNDPVRTIMQYRAATPLRGGSPGSSCFEVMRSAIMIDRLGDEGAVCGRPAHELLDDLG
jgi:hypothetical protein